MQNLRFGLTLSLLVAQALAGCAARDFSVSLAVPVEGDWAEYEVSGEGIHLETVRLEVGPTSVVRDAMGREREAFQVFQTAASESYSYSYIHWIDKTTNLAIRSVTSEGCDVRVSRCEGLVELRFEQAGMPWGYGSAMFQGVRFSEQSKAEKTLLYLERPVTLQITSHEFAANAGTLRVETSSLESNKFSSFYAYEGTFKLENGRSFVSAAALEVPSSRDGVSHRRDVRLTSQGSKEGAGPVPEPPSHAGLSRDRMPPSEHGPPETDHGVPFFGTSIDELLEAAAENNEKVREMMNREWRIGRADMSSGGSVATTLAPGIEITETRVQGYFEIIDSKNEPFPFLVQKSTTHGIQVQSPPNYSVVEEERAGPKPFVAAPPLQAKVGFGAFVHVADTFFPGDMRQYTFNIDFLLVDGIPAGRYVYRYFFGANLTNSAAPARLVVDSQGLILEVAASPEAIAQFDRLWSGFA